MYSIVLAAAFTTGAGILGVDLGGSLLPPTYWGSSAWQPAPSPGLRGPFCLQPVFPYAWRGWPDSPPPGWQLRQPPRMPPADEPDAETEGEPKIGMPASVVILAPREAVIMVNGTRLKRSAVREIFQTPRLVKGRNYHYEIVVTLERDGIPVRQTRRFQVQPGQRSEFDFRHLEKKRRLGDEKVPRPAPPKPVVE